MISGVFDNNKRRDGAEPGGEIREHRLNLPAKRVLRLPRERGREREEAGVAAPGGCQIHLP